MEVIPHGAVWTEREASKGGRKEQPVVGEEAQRMQSALKAGFQGGGNEPAELNATNLLGDFKANGDMDKNSLTAGGYKVPIGMGEKELEVDQVGNSFEKFFYSRAKRIVQYS